MVDVARGGGPEALDEGHQHEGLAGAVEDEEHQEHLRPREGEGVVRDLAALIVGAHAVGEQLCCKWGEEGAGGGTPRARRSVGGLRSGTCAAATGGTHGEPSKACSLGI